MNDRIKKVAIVGRDLDAWLTALTLQQSFHHSEEKLEITLIELTPRLTEHDFFTVIPSHKALHKLLGANENILLSAARAHYSYGHRFSGWSSGGAAFMHAYDRFGVDLNGVNFYQYWLKATDEGLRVPLEQFNLGAVAALNGRYVLLSDASTSFSHAASGLNLSAIPYVKAIAQAAISAGLIYRQSLIKHINIHAQKISSITLADDSEVMADFFIDASGAEGLLIKKIEPQNNFEDWSSWMPADRQIVASALPLEPKPGFNQIYAFNEGWAGFFPLADRTGVNISYSSKYISAKTAIEKVISISGIKFASAVESTFTPGQRKKHWINNCLAIGATAVNLEVLDSIQIHPLYAGLSLLRELFPNSISDMCESKIYNDKISSLAHNLRDFQIAHYYLNKRFSAPFWDAARSSPIPESLAYKIGLFEERGLIAIEEDETFFEENWLAIFAGHGIKTKSFDPLVNKTSSEMLRTNFQDILSYIKNEIEQMPSLQTHIEMTIR